MLLGLHRIGSYKNALLFKDPTRTVRYFVEYEQHRDVVCTDRQEFNQIAYDAKRVELWWVLRIKAREVRIRNEEQHI